MKVHALEHIIVNYGLYFSISGSAFLSAATLFSLKNPSGPGFEIMNIFVSLQPIKYFLIERPWSLVQLRPVRELCMSIYRQLHQI